MKLRDLRREDGPGLPRWTQCNLEGPYKGKREMVGSESEDAVMDAEVMAMPLEDREKGHDQGVLVACRNCTGQGSTFSPGASRRSRPCPHLDFSPVRPFWTPDLL